MNYKKLDATDIEFLVSILDKERVFTGEAINDDFSHDEMGGISKMPDVLVEVLEADEVSKIMKYANENMIPVVARGSGTGLVGASVPIYGGIMINMSRMNKILEIDEENLTLTDRKSVV